MAMNLGGPSGSGNHYNNSNNHNGQRHLDGSLAGFFVPDVDMSPTGIRSMIVVDRYLNSQMQSGIPVAPPGQPAPAMSPMTPMMTSPPIQAPFQVAPAQQVGNGHGFQQPGPSFSPGGLAPPHMNNHPSQHPYSLNQPGSGHVQAGHNFACQHHHTLPHSGPAPPEGTPNFAHQHPPTIQHFGPAPPQGGHNFASQQPGHIPQQSPTPHQLGYHLSHQHHHRGVPHRTVPRSYHGFQDHQAYQQHLRQFAGPPSNYHTGVGRGYSAGQLPTPSPSSARMGARSGVPHRSASDMSEPNATSLKTGLPKQSVPEQRKRKQVSPQVDKKKIKIDSGALKKETGGATTLPSAPSKTSQVQAMPKPMPPAGPYQKESVPQPGIVGQGVKGAAPLRTIPSGRPHGQIKFEPTPPSKPGQIKTEPRPVETGVAGAEPLTTVPPGTAQAQATSVATAPAEPHRRGYDAPCRPIGRHVDFTLPGPYAAYTSALATNDDEIVWYTRKDFRLAKRYFLPGSAYILGNKTVMFEIIPAARSNLKRAYITIPEKHLPRFASYPMRRPENPIADLFNAGLLHGVKKEGVTDEEASSADPTSVWDIYRVDHHFLDAESWAKAQKEFQFWGERPRPDLGELISSSPGYDNLPFPDLLPDLTEMDEDDTEEETTPAAAPMETQAQVPEVSTAPVPDPTETQQQSPPVTTTPIPELFETRSQVPQVSTAPVPEPSSAQEQAREAATMDLFLDLPEDEEQVERLNPAWAQEPIPDYLGVDGQFHQEMMTLEEVGWLMDHQLETERQREADAQLEAERHQETGSTAGQDA